MPAGQGPAAGGSAARLLGRSLVRDEDRSGLPFDGAEPFELFGRELPVPGEPFVPDEDDTQALLEAPDLVELPFLEPGGPSDFHACHRTVTLPSGIYSFGPADGEAHGGAAVAGRVVVDVNAPAGADRTIGYGTRPKEP